jgi:hypothetical protein
MRSSTANHLLAALFVSALLMPWYHEISLWVGIGLIAIIFTAINLEKQLKRDPVPYASLAFLVSGLQLIVAPWLAQYYPFGNDAYDIPRYRIAGYMAYAVPFCLALGLGMLTASLVARKARENVKVWTVRLDERAEHLVLNMFWATFALMIGQKFVPIPGTLSFFALLLSEVALVCPLILLIGQRRYWWKLAVLVLGWKLITSIGSTTFHSFLLWSAAYVMLYWSIEYRGRKFSYVLLAGLLFVTILQPAKVYFRTQQDRGLDSFATILLEYVTDPARAYAPENLAQTLVRFNQGWIVALALDWVPRVEPYAGSEILVRQTVGVLVPRLLLPDKYSVGGREYFTRFTGHELFGASMTLGYAGELYVAFGKEGGIMAAFVLGAVLGTGFRLLRKAALSNPLWWAWGPFLFLVAIKSEDTVGNALNWAVKGFVVVLLIRHFVPEVFRRLRRRPYRIRSQEYVR